MDAGTTAAIHAVLMPGFHGPELPQWLSRRLSAGLGSVCLFASNVVDADQLRALTAAIHVANPRAVVAIDEEGGDVTRLHHKTGSPFPSAAYLGRLDEPEFTQRVAARLGAQLRAVGVDLNLAPVADVNSNPLNPVIGVRSFGSRPRLVADHVAAFTTGLQRSGVAACAKHFPGHGDTSADSHRELPTITADVDQLRSRELTPFRAAVRAGTLAVMTSHILVTALDSQLPATLSAPVLKVLRTELGFTGVIVSDALDMAGASAERGIPEAAVLALAAGVDLLCIGTDNTDDELDQIVNHIGEAIDSGRLAAERVAEAAERVHAMMAALSLIRRDPSTPVETAAPQLTSDAFWCRAPLDPLQAPLLLRLKTPANIAAGETEWGLGEYLRPELDAALPGSVCATVSSLAELHAVLASYPGRRVVVQGRDFSRVEFLQAVLAELAAHRVDHLVIEQGWHNPMAHPPVDIATYGSGRGTMVSLLDLLAKGQR